MTKVYKCFIASPEDTTIERTVCDTVQNIRAVSRALRNSDYVEPELKKEVIQDILNGWKQISNVLFAIAPVLASDGSATIEGASFVLRGFFGNTDEQKRKMLLLVNLRNVVGLFRDDIYSSKIGPLLYDQLNNEKDALKKHLIALLIIFERPRNWKNHIQDYIVSLSKKSFYLFDTVKVLQARYRYDFASSGTLKEIEYLIKMGLAKHEFGDKKPGLDKIKRISNNVLPNREDDLDN